MKNFSFAFACLAMLGCEQGGATYYPPIETLDGGACEIVEPECADLAARVVDDLDGLCVWRWCIKGEVVTRAKPAGWPCAYRTKKGDPNSWVIGACDECGECI